MKKLNKLANINGAEYGVHHVGIFNIDFASKTVLIPVDSWKAEQLVEVSQPVSRVLSVHFDVWDETTIAQVEQGLENSELLSVTTPVLIGDWSPFFPIESFDKARSAAWARIKLARDMAEFGTFTYNGMVFDGDVNAQRRLAGYISVAKTKLGAGEPYERMFKLANNSLVTLTAQDFVNIETAKVDQIAGAFAHAEVLRAQINSATTQEQLEAIQWTL